MTEFPDSPDLSPAPRPHYGPEWAMILWRLIGYRKPLLDRLRDPQVELTPDERKFHADVHDGLIPRRRGTDKSVEVRREKLRRVATFLQYHIARQEPGRHHELVTNAEQDAANACGIGLRQLQLDVANVKKHYREWYDATERLAHKAATRDEKLESLRATY